MKAEPQQPQQLTAAMSSLQSSKQKRSKASNVAAGNQESIAGNVAAADNSCCSPIADWYLRLLCCLDKDEKVEFIICVPVSGFPDNNENENNSASCSFCLCFD